MKFPVCVVCKKRVDLQGGLGSPQWVHLEDGTVMCNDDPNVQAAIEAGERFIEEYPQVPVVQVSTLEE